ncbi:MAG: iron-containing alcohol dehydrogenase [Nitrosopumilus sp. B06]|nr:MAG: iron-containing alcohol dehydrogenase [Nitrosopumilus sp. B06]
MWSIKQPSKIIFGRGSAKEFHYPKECLVVTSRGAKPRGWLKYTGLEACHVFDSVESNPSMDTAEKIITEFGRTRIKCVVGIGGGSVLDVAKFCAFKMDWKKIMIPTTFGSGSEVTRISVLKIDGKKKSFHDEAMFADTAIIDSKFLDGCDEEIIKNSAIDACAQCTEAFDSTIANPYTKFLCNSAFDMLEQGILEQDHDKLAAGSLLDGLGFGNASTTLGHALSYVYSNEGIPHGHALAFTTMAAHRFNGSQYFERFSRLVKILGFEKIALEQDVDNAAELILTDRKHLDHNPVFVSKSDIIHLLGQINSGNI